MKKVIVIGAGIIGICCALALRRKEFEVILIDRQQPAKEASFGNAGVFNNSAIEPYQSPDIFKHLPRLLTNHDPRFRLHWPHFFLLLPNLFRFLSHCNTQSFEHGMKVLSYILTDSVELHLALLKQCRAESLFRNTGWLRLQSSEPQFSQTLSERRYYDRFGIRYEVLNEGEIAELEPDISKKYAKAIWLTDTPTVTSPEKVCLAYADYFKSLGGQFQIATAKQLVKIETGWNVVTQTEEMKADEVVVAMGAQSVNLLSTTGVKVPMFIERGHHLLFEPAAGKSLNRGIIDTQYGLVMTPMEMGLRVTSSVTLMAREIPTNFKQILDLVPEIHNIFPMRQQLSDKPWTGNRPSTPDTLPIIGPAVGQDKLWLAFGHGHLGFTLGPKTGILIADAMTGKTNEAMASSFLPARF